MSSITALQSADTGAASLTIINSNFSALNTDKIESLSDLSITASATEINYTTGVTSAIQTQLDAKEATITTLATTKGGTGLSSYTTGDIVYASATNTLSKLAIGSTGEVLQVSGGVPSWAAVAGTGDVTAASALTDNAVVLGDGGSKGVKVLSSLGTLNQVLTSGGAGVPPTWEDATTLSGTINEIAYFDSSTTIASLTVATYPSLTELTYLKGVTSAIQTQIGTKAPSTSPTFGTSITGSYLTASEILITDGSKNIVSAAVATYPSLTELTYVKGVTSAIQTQINGLPTASSTTTFTNKRITQRVVTTTDDATSVINIDTTDVYELSAVANNTEFTVTGTPTDGQKLIVRYKDAGVSKTLTWTFATALGITLPTATTAGKWCYVGLTYNLAATQWHAVAVSTQA